MTNTDERPAGHGQSGTTAPPPGATDTLRTTRRTCAALGALTRRAQDLRTLVASSLTAIDLHRRSGAALTFDEALELETARDQLLDLLGQVHQACDPYAVWAEVGEEPPAQETVAPAMVTIDIGDDPAGTHYGIVASAAAAMVGIDANEVISAWNEASERLFGWSEREAVGQPFSIIVPDGELEEFQRRCNRVYQGNPEVFETVRLHRDGSLVQVEVTPSAVFTSHGEVVGALATYWPVRRQTDRD